MAKQPHTYAWRPGAIDWTMVRADRVSDHGVMVCGVYFPIGEEAIRRHMRAMGLPLSQQVHYLADSMQALSCHSVESAEAPRRMLERLCEMGEHHAALLQRIVSMGPRQAEAQQSPIMPSSMLMQCVGAAPVAVAEPCVGEMQGYVETFSLNVPESGRVEAVALYDNLMRYHLLSPVCTPEQLYAALGFKTKLPQGMVPWSGFEYELRLFLATLVKNKVIRARGGETWRVAAQLFMPADGQRLFTPRGLCSSRPKRQAPESHVLDCIPIKWCKLNDRA